jgi:hypothetical protein
MADIAAANQEALDRLCRARPAWTAVRPAREALGLQGQTLLHAGPPIAWERMCWPMRGAVKASVSSRAGRHRLRAAPGGRGAIASRPAIRAVPSGRWPASSRRARPASRRGRGEPHDVGVVHRRRPLGHQLRFGGHGRETLEGLAWIRDAVAPAFAAVLEREGPIDLAG